MSNSPVDAIAQGLSFQGINARSTAIFADHLPGRRSGASLGHGMAAIRTANSTHRIGDTRSGAWSKRPLSWLSMTPEQVLSHPARILSTGQRESYFTEGYLGVESLISEDWLERLREATEESVAGAAAVTESDGVFDVAPGHTPDRPRLRRVRLPDDQHPTFWEFATDVIADVAADLVGPDVVFHHSKLNFKWDQHDDAVNWHQDIQFYPHTNYSPLTIGTYLTDTGRDDGPLMVVARSHEGPLHDQYDADGNWVGRLSDEAAAAIDPERVRLPDRACRVDHRSQLQVGPWLSAEQLGFEPPAPAQRVRVCGCVSLHAPAPTVGPRRRGRAGEECPLGSPRSEAVSHSSGVGHRVRVDLRRAIGERHRLI